MKQNRLFLLALAALLIALLVPSFAMAEAGAAQHVATKVQINYAFEPTIELKVGYGTYPNARAVDDNGSSGYWDEDEEEWIDYNTGADWDWSVADPAIVRVQANGNLTALAVGETKVTATWGQLTGTATVKVTQPEPNAYDKITLSTSTFAMTAGGNSVDINSYMKVYKKDVKQDFDDDEFEYTSSDEDVATVEDYGWISPRGKGTATITVTAKANPQATATATVNVTTVEPTELKFKKAEYTIELSADEDENDKSLEFSRKPTNASLNVKDLTFTSSDPSVAKITSKGSSYVYVLGRKPGEATITVKYSDTVLATTKVTVVATKPTALAFEEAAYEIDMGESETRTLFYTPEPASALIKKSDLTYAVSDTSVLKITGKSDRYVSVKALKAGEATVTVKYSDTVVATAKVTVTAAKPTSLVFDEAAYEIDMGENADKTLNFSAEPDNAAYKKEDLTYTVSDASILKITGKGTGYVTVEAKKPGEATVTVKYSDTVVATAKVTVTATKPTKLVFEESEYAIKLCADSSWKELNFSAEPENATYEGKELTYTSSDPSVVKIEDKNKYSVGIRAKKPGEATITVKYSDAVVATAKVTVTAVDPTGVSIPKKAYTLNYMRPTDGIQNSTSKNIEWNLEPADAWYKEATWTSSDFGVAMVDDGYVWATGVGTATITLTVEDSTGAVKTATTTVNVTGKAINLALSKSSATITLTKGGANTLQLNAIDAKTKDDVSVNWKTSDKSIATVVDGLVTAKKAGKVTITATTKDGNATKKSCKITVKPQKVTKLTATKKLTMTVGEKKALSVTVKPDNAFNTNLAYSSSKSSIVSVDKNGKLTAKKAGKAVITVKTKDGSKKSVKITVTVNAKK